MKWFLIFGYAFYKDCIALLTATSLGFQESNCSIIFSPASQFYSLAIWNANCNSMVHCGVFFF
jgi:hypothetical protein